LLVGVLRARGLTEPLRRRHLDYPAREVMSYSVPLMTHDISAVLLSAMGTVLLGILSTGGEVAELRAVLPIATTLAYVLSTFGLLLAPAASRLRARGESDQVHRVYWQTAAWTMVFCLPVALIGLLFSEPLTLFLFGERYAEAGTVLPVLVVGYFATAALGPNATMLAVYDRVRFVVWTNVGGVVLNLVLSIVLIKAAGALGAAIAATVTFLVLNLTWQLELSRTTDVGSFDRSYTRLYVLTGAVTVVLAIISFTLSPPLLVAVPLVLAGWVVILVSAREQLAASETFGDLADLPVLRRILRTRGPRV
jgi:O-antigen/teichoic acid export membrane protein